ncbi:SMC-Scp complex subunit ScpB [Chitinophaga ginsengisegetis]|uniref:SMC-Scp complex subunit ScpB n=1 Tax=Chitinophaga ginsengisegetis TaxID=393003 RepID=UPI000DBFE97F|nr:SMC-Scp complex subunit ScpB [Chitinophaga ginsengisegetis]MDR6565556.1 segregation and condensation protein B [Chitinophaga ginsengisegetis]MDR6645285.1 segregation and condensation protein B [Chitinophaga ginsengisegetis]MDR6652124.1 segregation and condensation protein B [Chitinophaga ginsengisegetis]
MEISQIIPHVEALIFAADRPLPLLEIVDLLNNALAFLEDRTNLDQVEAAMEAIREKYSSEFYAFEVRSSGGGYQFLTKKEYYQTVAQLNGDKFLKRLSTAALETLAIIAYRQPISKGEIEYIRGVSTDYSIQKLLEKELIVITGRSEDQPGKPLLYAVSRSFMDYFGISSVADLPKLKELFDEEMVQPTLITDDTATLGRGEHNTHTAEAETAHSLMVSEDGELLDPDHQLDHLAATTPDAEEEPPASEDEEVEPDDEIVRFDDIIEEVNEELGGGEESENDTSTAEEDEEEEDEDPYAVKDTASRIPGEENEDPDGIVEDVISGEEGKEEDTEDVKEEEDTEEDEDDGDKDPDDMMEDAILGEKLLVVSGPGVEDEDEEEEDDEEDDDDDDYDDDDEEDDEDEEDENDDNSGKK